MILKGYKKVREIFRGVRKSVEVSFKSYKDTKVFLVIRKIGGFLDNFMIRYLPLLHEILSYFASI